jgi:uncharacterized membrane protein YdjX (TVP38/TMEM64 family)
LFGLPAGLAVVITGALIGASTAFGPSRTLGRQAVTRLDSQRLRRLDELLRRHRLLAVIGILPAALAFVTIGAYGDTPGSTPFLVAVGGLALLTLAGAAAARGRGTAGRSSSAATAISRPDGRSTHGATGLTGGEDALDSRPDAALAVDAG